MKGTSKKTVAVGNIKPNWPGMPRVVCAFDEETFTEIRQRAIADETSFAEQVRRLVEWGLESAQ